MKRCLLFMCLAGVMVLAAFFFFNLYQNEEVTDLVTTQAPSPVAATQPPVPPVPADNTFQLKVIGGPMNN